MTGTVEIASIADETVCRTYFERARLISPTGRKIAAMSSPSDIGLQARIAFFS